MMRLLAVGLLVSIALAGLEATSQTQKDYDINTALMKATFKLEGRTAQGQTTLGTAFIMGRPYSHPPADQPQKARFVLITAAHVLNEMQGDQAILHLRREASKDSCVVLPANLDVQGLVV
jgi:hypothetical protein